MLHYRNKTAWPLYLAWLGVLAAVIGLNRRINSEHTEFQGIAETRELDINSEKPTEIKQILVVEGQAVTKGQLLVELQRPELNLTINEIAHQLDRLKVQKGVNKKEIQADIDRLEAERQARMGEFSSRIRQLENQLDINKALTAGLKSINQERSGQKATVSNPILLKIDSLKQEQQLTRKPIDIKIETLQKILNTSENPLKIQVTQLEQELAMLNAEKSKLHIHAQISGIIGSVNYKPGAKVAPFAPILTLHTQTPAFVKGYIYENLYTRIAMGNPVRVHSLTGNGTAIAGEVIGIGARIVEYPVRLRKRPDFQMWGREVMVRIPSDNPFILGEKVSISTHERKRNLLEQLAGLVAPSPSLAKTPEKEINDRSGVMDVSDDAVKPIYSLQTQGIEASGVLYLDDLDQYLIVSDDTPHKKPLIFLMDREGQITNEITLAGLSKIDDMESITRGEDNTIYIASSLSLDKKGRLKKKRCQLISLKRHGTEFELTARINLRALLEKTAQQAPESQWGQFLSAGVKAGQIDLEGLFYHQGALFLGFKAPLKERQPVILKIDRIDQAMQTQTLDPRQVSIWRTLALNPAVGPNSATVPERITGMFFQAGQLYFTSTADKVPGEKRHGRLWQYSPDSNVLKARCTFTGLKPEGITATRQSGALMVVFDQGGKHQSLYTIVTEASCK